MSAAPARAPLAVMVPLLFRLQLAGLRRHWRPYVIVSAVMPAGIVLLLHVVAPGLGRSEQIRVVMGDMILAETMSAVVMLSQQLAWLRESRALDHYLVLPVSVPLYLAVISLCYSLFAWPGVACIAIEGAVLYGLPLHASAAILPILLLSGLALGGIGAVIGLLSPREGLAGLFGNLVMMGILFAGLVPSSAASAWTVWALRLVPSSYGISLLQQATLGGAVVWSDWMGLAVYAVVLLGIAVWAMQRPE